MKKNTIVLDELGNIIGQTYAKRAKGLVKNGRAEYVNDCTIRMMHTSSRTDTFDYVEEQDMSNVINFNARDFKFDKTFEETKIGSRMFITDVFGESVEIYELGDGSDTAVRLFAEKTLEKDTDYVFRFSMTREGEEAGDGLSQFLVVPFAGEEVTEDDMEEGYVFNLAKNQYKPVICKNWNNQELKVYEIPFHVGEAEKIRFYFVEKAATARILPGKEVAAYQNLQDFSYVGWLSEKKDQIENKIKDSIPKDFNPKDFIPKDFNVEQTMKGAKETMKGAKETMKGVGVSVVSAVGKFSDYVFNAVAEGEQNAETKAEQEGEAPTGLTQCIHRGENMTSEELAILLQNVTGGSVVDFSNCDIRENEYLVDGGEAVAGSNFIAKYASLSGQGFVTLLRKMGDGCNADFSFSNIESVRDLDSEAIAGKDGNNVILNNCNIAASAFAMLMSLIGDGCLVEISGANIYEDGSDFAFGKAVDGTAFRLQHVNMSDTIKEKLQGKIGIGCDVIGL